MPIKIVTPFADTGDKTTVPPTDASNFVNFSKGYTPDYALEIGQATNAKPVERDKMNYLFNLVTGEIKSWQEAGFSQWYNPSITGITYPLNAFVFGSDGKPYRSKIANNSANPIGSANWELVLTVTDIESRIPMLEKGSAYGGDIKAAPTGFYEFANLPTGGPAEAGAGALECKVWGGGSSWYGFQRYTSSAVAQQWIRSGTGTASTTLTWTTWVPTAFSFKSTLNEYGVLDAYSSKNSGGNLCPDAALLDRAGDGTLTSFRAWTFAVGSPSGSGDYSGWSIDRTGATGNAAVWKGQVTAVGSGGSPELVTHTNAKVTCDSGNFYDVSVQFYSPALVNIPNVSFDVGAVFYDAFGSILSGTDGFVAGARVRETNIVSQFRRTYGGRVQAPRNAIYMAFSLRIAATSGSGASGFYFSNPMIVPFVGYANNLGWRNNLARDKTSLDAYAIDPRVGAPGGYYITTDNPSTNPVPLFNDGVLTVNRLDTQNADGTVRDVRVLQQATDATTGRTSSRIITNGTLGAWRTDFQIQDATHSCWPAQSGFDWDSQSILMTEPVLRTVLRSSAITFASPSVVTASSHTPFQQYGISAEEGTLETFAYGQPAIIQQRYTAFSGTVYTRHYPASSGSGTFTPWVVTPLNKWFSSGSATVTFTKTSGAGVFSAASNANYSVVPDTVGNRFILNITGNLTFKSGDIVGTITMSADPFLNAIYGPLPANPSVMFSTAIIVSPSGSSAVAAGGQIADLTNRKISALVSMTNASSSGSSLYYNQTFSFGPLVLR